MFLEDASAGDPTHRCLLNVYRCFLKMHQEATLHGLWRSDQPLPNSRGRVTAQCIDCTRSGDVTFSCPSVERKLRKLVRQCSKSEEPKIADQSPG